MAWRWLAVAVISSCLASFAAAQELTTDAERTWRELRNSDDVRTKLMAERWYNAIRQQEWSDASGKFSVSAKYVDHDPELTWVKLRVIRGTGRERAVKDVQIPLAKLSKACQARVKTISALREKLADAAQAEKEKEKDDTASGNRAAGITDELGPEVEPRDSRGRRDVRDDQSTEHGERSRRRPANRRREAAPPQQDVVTIDGPPLPALLPPLPATGTGDDSPPLTAERTAPAVSTSAGGEPPSGVKHPKTPEELKLAFEQAFVSGDKDALQQLVYWGDLSPEQRQFTHFGLLDYAGVAQLHRCDVSVEAAGKSAAGYTITSSTYLLIEIETRADYVKLAWPLGEIGGRYVLGALTQATELSERR